MNSVETVIGFAFGYWLGTRQGREGMQRALDSAREIWASPETRRLAAEVQALLLDRAGKLAGHGREASLTLNYWDHVTLAEAQLLLGRFASSRQTYREAFGRYAEQQGNIEVSRRQAVEILGALGHSTASTEAFFESFPSERQPEGPDAHDQADQEASA